MCEYSENLQIEVNMLKKTAQKICRQLADKNVTIEDKRFVVKCLEVVRQGIEQNIKIMGEEHAG